MYYLEKGIKTESGVLAYCWVISDKKEVLYRQQMAIDAKGLPTEGINPSDFEQTGTVTLIGYVNKDEWLAGNLPLSKPKVVSLGNLEDYKQITLESLSEYVNIYNACQAVCLQKIMSIDEFNGAILKNSDEE